MMNSFTGGSLLGKGDETAAEVYMDLCQRPPFKSSESSKWEDIAQPS